MSEDETRLAETSCQLKTYVKVSGKSSKAKKNIITGKLFLYKKYIGFMSKETSLLTTDQFINFESTD